MSNLVSSILEKQFDAANQKLAEAFEHVLRIKLLEMKKLVAAKMFAEMKLDRMKPDYDSIEDRRGERAVNSSLKTDKQQPQTVDRSGKGDNASSNVTVVPKNNMQEARSYGKVDAALDAASFIPGPVGSVASLGSAVASATRGDYAGAALDVAGAIPGVGYLAKGAKVGSKLAKVGKASRMLSRARKFVRNRIDSMASKGSSGNSNSDAPQTSTKYSPTGTTSKLKINVVGADKKLNEARIKILTRVRGGKIQRRKKVSNVPGMTIRGGKLTRMSPAERRRRKMGARVAKVKRRTKRTQANMKRKRSLMRRKAMGL